MEQITIDMNNIKVGDLFYIVHNTGMAGISQYQYIGIFTDHATNEKKHVFISGHFVSTVCILAGKENSSRSLKTIFYTKSEAEEYQRQERKREYKHFEDMQP